ncbi:hypothetical protein STAS_18673 [Striga asiatica]|uniref:Uncharacterized protein n=1 Tax=Striga asiatica TaxID=4170 RepID=A0A5A7Q9I3_STRAF|nr:hypothetical protein STAS_18673 [Striga asiatica]
MRRNIGGGGDRSRSAATLSFSGGGHRWRQLHDVTVVNCVATHRPSVESGWRRWTSRGGGLCVYVFSVFACVMCVTGGGGTDRRWDVGTATDGQNSDGSRHINTQRPVVVPGDHRNWSDYRHSPSATSITVEIRATGHRDRFGVVGGGPTPWYLAQRALAKETADVPKETKV